MLQAAFTWFQTKQIQLPSNGFHFGFGFGFRCFGFVTVFLVQGFDGFGDFSGVAVFEFDFGFNRSTAAGFRSVTKIIVRFRLVMHHRLPAIECDQAHPRSHRALPRARAFQFQQSRLALAAQYFDAGGLSRETFQVLRLLQLRACQNIAIGKIAPRIGIFHRRQIRLLTRLQGDGFGLGNAHSIAVHLFGHNFVFVGKPIDDLLVTGRGSMGTECAGAQQQEQYRTGVWHFGHGWPFNFLKMTM